MSGVSAEKGLVSRFRANSGRRFFSCLGPLEGTRSVAYVRRICPDHLWMDVLNNL